MPSTKHASTRHLKSDFKRVDAHEIEDSEYDEIPELTDETFAGGIIREGGRQVGVMLRLADSTIGFIQSYVVIGSGGGWWEDETGPGARGIDQFLCDPRRLNQGLGRRMIRAFVGILFRDPAVSVVQTDSDPANLRAVRCYAAAGFQAVKQVSTPDGPALLMRCTRESLAHAAGNAP